MIASITSTDAHGCVEKGAHASHNTTLVEHGALVRKLAQVCDLRMKDQRPILTAIQVRQAH